MPEAPSSQAPASHAGDRPVPAGSGSGGPLWALGAHVPQVDPTAWIAPTATVIGRVTLGAQVSIWFGVVLRGDSNRIVVGARTNVQDLSLLHVNPTEGHACLVGEDVTIGHGAIVHACTLEDRAFVGMGAIVLDGAVIEEGGMLAAGALLAPGKRIGRNELWAGTPARRVRVMEPAERARFDLTAPGYVARGAEFRDGLRGLGQGSALDPAGGSAPLHPPPGGSASWTSAGD